MKRFPRLLATTLIFALLNVSYINLALARSAPSTKALTATPVSTFATEPHSLPQDDPCVPKVTKQCIKQDLDDVKKFYDDLKGSDSDGLLNRLITETGLDPDADILEAKNEIDNTSDTDFESQQGHWDKAHNRFKKHKKKLDAMLSNRPLLALLHRPFPRKFRLVVNGTAAPAPGGQKAIFSPTQDANRSFPTMKSAATRGEFSKNLAGLNVVLVPEFTSTCNTGTGLTNGIDDYMIAKGVSLGLEVVRELIPDDTAAVLPQVAAVTAWGLAKVAELAVELIHLHYIECNNAQQEARVNGNLASIKTTVEGINTHTTGVKNDILSGINTSKTDIVNNNNSIKTDIINNDDTNKNAIITKIGEGAGQTTQAVESSTTTINTNITNNISNLNTTITNSKNEVNTNIDNSKTFIINNANVNASNALRLMIEADLSEPDSSVPIGLFMTPASKGGYLELVRSIVFETIRNLTGATIAQANAQLASADSLIATGKYKAAYAALRKAYKSATG